MRLIQISVKNSELLSVMRYGLTEKQLINLNELNFTLLGKSTFEVVPRSKPLCKIAVSKHGFETAMRGKLLFSPHPLALRSVCGDSVPAPLPEGKNFLKKIFSLWTPFSKNFNAPPVRCLKIEKLFAARNNFRLS